MRCLRLILSLLLIPLGSMSQSVSTYFQFEKPLYGAAYYSEYTPTDRLDEDIRLMKQANLSVVRIGESTWSVFEPQNGVFQFEWMDRIIDKLSKAGIKIILGTPTYSIPAWMAHQHPEVLSQTVDVNFRQAVGELKMDIVDRV